MSKPVTAAAGNVEAFRQCMQVSMKRVASTCDPHGEDISNSTVTVCTAGSQDEFIYLEQPDNDNECRSVSGLPGFVSTKDPDNAGKRMAELFQALVKGQAKYASFEPGCGQNSDCEVGKIEMKFLREMPSDTTLRSTYRG